LFTHFFTERKLKSEQLLSNVKNATDFTGFTSQFNFQDVTIFTMRDRERETLVQSKLGVSC